ncbi:MAG: hypothetical protein KGD58_14320 [Candidatus Lokiarchaeota archaeon]|nr:hypothetical protein [Candidatus Lokiarchaeota archaeon]
MKRKMDFMLFMGIFFFSFGIISISYGIIVLIIRVSFGFIGIMYVKDILFDLVFLLLGFLLIRQKKHPNPRKRQLKFNYKN